ncbi:hypothetical protein [Paraclostridium bifermentans]|nr:hypothetical protein [Paraclostridium bifermentans]
MGTKQVIENLIKGKADVSQLKKRGSYNNASVASITTLTVKEPK